MFTRGTPSTVSCQKNVTQEVRTSQKNNPKIALFAFEEKNASCPRSVSKPINLMHKNGEKMKKYFAVVYMDAQGVERAFYPDYIIKFADEQVGIYDTKAAGFQVEDTKVKAEALQTYIKEQKKVVGGIVIFEDGVAKVNSKEVYRDFREGAEDWADF